MRAPIWTTLNEQISNLFDVPNDSQTHSYLRQAQENVYTGQDRRLEDVDYWRKRAGWFDDDEAMKAYNEGVYDTFYSTDDDKVGKSKGSASARFSNFLGSGDIVKTSIKVFAGIVGVAVFILLVRAVRRRSQSRKKTRKISSLVPESSARSTSKRSSSRSRSRSKSKLRGSRSSRSRSRRRREKSDDEEGKGYNLMEDGEATKSSRSKSKDKKSRSSRSRSRARKEGSARETMLV